MQRLSHRRCVLAAALVGAAFVSSGAQATGKVEENAATIYLARDFVFVDSPVIEGYLRAVCKRLLDAKGATIAVPNILVQSSDAFSAFVDANGSLVISTGALRALESEGELAALLGHELSHLILRHPQDKDALRALPLGLETVTSMKDAAAELQSRRPSSGDAGDLIRIDPTDTQTTGTLWSDFIAPSWNRKQEQEADESGFELMRAAGYDPSAFGQLFSRLQDAEAKRSQRLQVLKKTLVARLHANAPVALGSDVKNAATEAASEKLIDNLAVFNRSYDSPDDRQAHLAAYAREHRENKRNPHPESGFKETLHAGEGSSVLALDDAALKTLDAVTAKNAAAAAGAVKLLGSTDAKPPSAHLNFALGSYYQAYGKPEAGAAAADAWLEGARPPAQAFLWSASYKAKASDYQAALDRLEAGRKRVGDSTPFLPTLVATARASGNMSLARSYTRECRAESGPFTDKLYADCVRALGEKPPEDVVADSVMGKAREGVFNLLRKK